MIRVDGLPGLPVRARRDAPENVPLFLLVAEAPVDLSGERLQLNQRFRCEACDNRLADVIRIGRTEAA
jgi:hypothetical protein